MFFTISFCFATPIDKKALQYLSIVYCIIYTVLRFFNFESLMIHVLVVFCKKKTFLLDCDCFLASQQLNQEIRFINSSSIAQKGQQSSIISCFLTYLVLSLKYKNICLPISSFYSWRLFLNENLKKLLKRILERESSVKRTDQNIFEKSCKNCSFN